jgi:HEAT repeat protein
MVNEISIDTLIKQLSDKDGLVREKARLTLVDIGKEATLALTKLLTDKDQQTRWEAAKALVAIADPVAIPALIKTLEDNIFDIRWLASEALVTLGTDSVIPLLETLSRSSENLFLREEARHVLKYILRDNPAANELNTILKPVIDALNGSAAGVATPGAANTALEKLKRLQGAVR